MRSRPSRSWCLALAVLALGACARGPDQPPSLPASAATRPRVTLQTDWFPQGEHGGFYQALAAGHYAAAGLEVEIWPGGPGAGIRLKVARGDADFGMLRADDVLLAASRGLPLVMVMATLQHDPLALMLHADSPVRAFPDLAGRTVIGNVGMAWMPYLERRFGITFEKRQNTYGLGEFLGRPDLIQQCMVTNEPYFARAQGRDVRWLSLAAAGYDAYHVVVARRALVRDRPELVRAFVAASILGWQEYLHGDPAAADALIRQRNPQMSPGLLAHSRRELVAGRFVTGDPAAGERIGRLDPARLAELAGQLRELGILEASLDLAEVVQPPAP
ncbi:MAG: ABC transporter substrate-binding protein [Opitutaceae bacterium]